MKKLISLLLAVVMVFGLLALTAHADDVDMPPEVDAESAGVKVTNSATKDGPAETYCFETLSNAVIKWAIATLPGNKTFTLLKDLDVSQNEPYNSTSQMMIPATNSMWYGGKGGATQQVTFDLNGHTLSYSGDRNLFFIQRYGCAFKNGTILYTCVGSTRSVVAVGLGTSYAATSSGTTVWEPKISFDDIKAYNLTDGSAAVLNNFLYAPRITIKNSTFWSQNGQALRLAATDQSNIPNANPYEGEYDAQVTITKSIVGSGKGHALNMKAPAKIKIGDSAFVSGTEEVVDPSADFTLTVVGGNDQPTVISDWSAEQDGMTLSGVATVYGQAPGEEPLPFTDVAESDWFYEFVNKMYRQKVISGMTATTFVPNGTLTYGQALKLLVAAIDTDVGNATTGHWASKYLEVAKAKGWVDGDVELDGKITRLSFCQIAAKAKELTEQPAANPFKDTSDTAVLALVNAGVINGMSADTFAPDNPLTRAQIAKIIALLKAL